MSEQTEKATKGHKTPQEPIIRQVARDKHSLMMLERPEMIGKKALPVFLAARRVLNEALAGE
jgi:hypothetical protein